MTPLEERSSKHTAGEWRIEGRRGAGYIISAGVNAEGDGPRDYVGVIDPMFHVAGERSDEHAANARLIAASPTLLEALRKVHMSAVIIPGVPTEAALSVNVLKEVEAALRLATEPTNER